MFRDYRISYCTRHVKIREAVPLSFLRQSVGYLLSYSARKIPHAAGITELDVTPLVEYTSRGEDNSESSLDEKSVLKRAIRRNYSAFFLKALAHAVYHVPCLNGFLEFSLLRNGGTLYHAEDINFSFTVHTKFGVIKPIVRNPHQKDIETVANEMRELTRKARRTDPDELYHAAARKLAWSALRELDPRAVFGFLFWMREILFSRRRTPKEFQDVPPEQKLRVEDILGATCTLANIGMMVSGHQTVTVIIPPEVSMFGLGDFHLAPRVVDGRVVPRWVVTMCATMDHRAYDAGEAFPVYHHLLRYLENPALIYEWKPGDPI